MPGEIREPLYCSACRRAVSPFDDFCRGCGQSQRNAAATPPGAAPNLPQAPPQIVVVTRTVPPPAPSTGVTLLKIMLTGMGIAGGLWLGCIGLILLGGVLVLCIILAGAGSH